MLFIYNDRQSAWQYIPVEIMDVFGYTVALNHTEIMIFGRWYKFQMVSPD